MAHRMYCAARVGSDLSNAQPGTAMRLNVQHDKHSQCEHAAVWQVSQKERQHLSAGAWAAHVVGGDAPVPVYPEGQSRERGRRSHGARGLMGTHWVRAGLSRKHSGGDTPVPVYPERQSRERGRRPTVLTGMGAGLDTHTSKHHARHAAMFTQSVCVCTLNTQNLSVIFQKFNLF